MSSKSVTKLHTLLEISATAHPHRAAVQNAAGHTLTYAQLNDSAGGLARHLTRAGVAPGDRVGIYLPKSLGSVVGLFAVLKSGAGYVPIDVTAPPQRSGYVAGDCCVKALITDGSGLDKLLPQLPPEAVEAVEELDQLRDVHDDLRLVRMCWPGAGAGRPTDAEALAYILYTSGSTGNPKGVVHTHGSALSFVHWCSDVIVPSENDRFSSHAPFHFDLSIFDLFVPIKHGGCIVLIDEELGKQPMRLAPFIAEQDISVWYSTPSILRLLIDYGKLHAVPAPNLRTVIFAGEVFPLKYLRRLQDILPHAEYFNFYGPTETNVCTYFPVPCPVPEEDYESLPIGYDCSDDRGRVVDESGDEVAAGEEGELVVCGGSVMQGYWNLPERNAAAFFADAEGNRWYRTGDVVQQHSELGYLYRGRRDRMVKRRGYRVELGEIEAVLYRHEAISEAAVVAQTDAESGVRIEAFVAWAGEGKPSRIALKKYSAENLPPYMIPDAFTFLEALPKTSTDKIDYQRLRSASD